MKRKLGHPLLQSFNDLRRNDPEKKRIQRWADWINGLGLGLAFIGLYPKFSLILVLLLMVQPILCLGILHCFSGKIHLEADKRTEQPHILAAFLSPFIILSLRALMDCRILAWNAFWLPFVLISFAFFALVIWWAIGIRSPILLLIFCFVYGFGATLTLNKALDDSAPAVYSTQVLAKKVHYSSKGGYSFYFTISPRGPVKTVREVQVNKDVYHRRDAGDNVKFKVYHGAFSIPWYDVR